MRIKKLREDLLLDQKQLANILGVSQPTISDWETGRKVPSTQSAEKLANFFGVSMDYLWGRTERKSKKIPVLGRVQAGMPIEAIEEIIDFEEISEQLASTGEFFGLKIKGDSMIPTLSEDDVIIVRKQSTVDNNELAVVLVNGSDATVKRIIKSIIGITLLPDNVKYEPMFYDNKEICDLPIAILGKVVELRRKL